MCWGVVASRPPPLRGRGHVAPPAGGRLILLCCHAECSMASTLMGVGACLPPRWGGGLFCYVCPAGPWRGAAGPPCAIPPFALLRVCACLACCPAGAIRWAWRAALAAVSALAIALTKAGWSVEVPDWSMSASLPYFLRSTSETMPVRFVNRRWIKRRRMEWLRRRTASRNCLRAWWKVRCQMNGAPFSCTRVVSR